MEVIFNPEIQVTMKLKGNYPEHKFFVTQSWQPAKFEMSNG